MVIWRLIVASHGERSELECVGFCLNDSTTGSRASRQAKGCTLAGVTTASIERDFDLRVHV